MKPPPGVPWDAGGGAKAEAITLSQLETDFQVIGGRQSPPATINSEEKGSPRVTYQAGLLNHHPRRAGASEGRGREKTAADVGGI
jgi:hypothetical protein